MLESSRDQARVFDPKESGIAHEPDMNELGIIIGHRLLELMKGKVTLQNRTEGGLRVVLNCLRATHEGIATTIKWTRSGSANAIQLKNLIAA